MKLFVYYLEKRPSTWAWKEAEIPEAIPSSRPLNQWRWGDGDGLCELVIESSDDPVAFARDLFQNGLELEQRIIAPAAIVEVAWGDVSPLARILELLHHTIPPQYEALTVREWKKKDEWT